MEYKKQLQDKRWREKRRGILRRDNHKCFMCGNKNELDVHHVFYFKGDYRVWDCPDDLLITLCRECHDSEHNMGRVSSEVYKIIRHVLCDSETLAERSRKIDTEINTTFKTNSHEPIFGS